MPDDDADEIASTGRRDTARPNAVSNGAHHPA